MCYSTCVETGVSIVHLRLNYDLPVQKKVFVLYTECMKFTENGVFWDLTSSRL